MLCPEKKPCSAEALAVWTLPVGSSRPLAGQSGSLVPVRSLGGLLQLLIRLIEQLFCLLGVATHVVLVGLLGRDNTLIRLLRQTLRGGDIRVTAGVDVAGRGLQGDGSRADQAESEKAKRDLTIELHRGHSP